MGKFMIRKSSNILTQSQIRNSSGLAGERCPDLSNLQVPGDHQESVPAPAGSLGQGPLQGEDRRRASHQEALHLSRARLREQALPGLAG